MVADHTSLQARRFHRWALMADPPALTVAALVSHCVALPLDELATFSGYFGEQLTEEEVVRELSRTFYTTFADGVAIDSDELRRYLQEHTSAYLPQEGFRQLQRAMAAKESRALHLMEANDAEEHFSALARLSFYMSDFEVTDALVDAFPLQVKSWYENLKSKTPEWPAADEGFTEDECFS